MQNAWQPVSGLDRVGQILVGNSTSSLSNVQSQCAAPPCSFPRVIDQLGARALFAVLDQGTASAYDFPTAHLVNAAGHAVAPTTDGVSAGLSSMTTNADGITQTSNFASTNSAAYPLSVVDYAMVPTCGVSASTATGIQNFLSHVESSQTYGVEPGTIAPGYLALTSHQLGQLTAASSAVSSAACAPRPLRRRRRRRPRLASSSSHSATPTSSATEPAAGAPSGPAAASHRPGRQVHSLGRPHLLGAGQRGRGWLSHRPRCSPPRTGTSPRPGPRHCGTSCLGCSASARCCCSVDPASTSPSPPAPSGSSPREPGASCDRSRAGRDHRGLRPGPRRPGRSGE